MEKYGRAREATDGNIIWRMRVACWITKATNTHWAYIIVTAFLRQEWLRERTWMSHLYVHCPSCCDGLPTIATFGNGKSDALLLLRSLDKSGDRVDK